MVNKNVALLLAWLCFAIPAICFASGYSSPGISTPVSIANGGTGSPTAAAHTVFGNTTGSTAAPAYTSTPSFTSFAATGASTIVNGTDVTGLDIYRTIQGSTRIFGVRGEDNVYALEVTDDPVFGRGVAVRGNMSTNLIDVFPGSSIVMHAGQLLLEDAGATHVNSYFDAGGNLIFQPATDIVPITVAGGGVKSAHLMDFTGNGTNGFVDQYGGYTGRSFTDLGGGQMYNNALTIGSVSTSNSTVGSGTTCKKETFGTATLSSGTVTITDSSITANSVITLTEKAASSVAEMFTVELTAGSGFTIHSNNVASTSVLMWDRKEP